MTALSTTPDLSSPSSTPGAVVHITTSPAPVSGHPQDPNYYTYNVAAPPSVVMQAVAPPPPVSNPLNFPPVVYMSERGPIYLQSAGWGEVPPGNPVPLVAYMVTPQPQLNGLKVPIPPTDINAVSHQNIRPTNTSVEPDLYELRFRWRGGAEISRAGKVVYTVKERMKRLVLLDGDGLEIGKVVCDSFKTDSTSTFYMNEEEVGKAVQRFARLKPHPMDYHVKGWIISCDPFHWMFEIRNQAGKLLIRLDRLDQGVQEQWKIRSYCSEDLALAILVFVFTKLRLRRWGM